MYFVYIMKKNLLSFVLNGPGLSVMRKFSLFNIFRYLKHFCRSNES